MPSNKRGKNPSLDVQRELWAKSGGVCQYPGCDKILYRDNTVYWKQINLGEVAHNVGSSANGPRGDINRSHDLSDDPENLLMLCRDHHKTVDALDQEYREETLNMWKSRHESQVLAAAQTTKGYVALPIIFNSSQIGGHPVRINKHEVVRALIDHGVALAAKPQEIIIDTTGQPDNSDSYWEAQVNTIRDQIRFIRAQMDREHMDAPIALFPLAEMPALMALGHAIGDKSNIEIFQYSRHAGSWAFAEYDSQPEQFKYKIPSKIDTDVALVISLSANIEDERVTSALKESDIPIIHFKVDSPSTELVKTPKTVEVFRQKFRQCLTEIESKCSNQTKVHVFPCMPASLATAFGCCIMPKVSNPIVIYDAKNFGGEFRKCITLPFELDQQNKIISIN